LGQKTPSQPETTCSSRRFGLRRLVSALVTSFRLSLRRFGAGSGDGSGGDSGCGCGRGGGRGGCGGGGGLQKPIAKINIIVSI